MSVSKAIILAAGSGSRLRPLTAERPKCLLEVGGSTLLQHQLEGLAHSGITDVVIVVGFRGDQVRRHAGSRVRYIENERYAGTNSLYSLWLARDELAGGAFILNSDVLAPRELFDRLQYTPAPDAVLVELGSRFEAEDMKVMLREGRVVDFGKDLPAERSNAHNVGVARFGREGADRLVECLDELVAAGHENDWVPMAFRQFARQWPLTAIATDGLPWIEIDFPQDLARAREQVWPTMLALTSAVAV